MRFITYNYNNSENVGILNGDVIIPINEVLNTIGANEVKSMVELIESSNGDLIDKLDIAVKSGSFSSISIKAVKLVAPIPYPKRNILCLGKNYAEHAKELGKTKISDTSIPDAPIYFTKAASSVAANEEPVKFSYEVTKEVDYEVELAIIIGKEGINIKPEDAEDYIFGYTIVNDISARDLQAKHKQWFKAKSLETFCPIGPSIVHKNEISFPVELDIQCRINGELRQNSNTCNLVFDIPYIISDLSKGFALQPGDIICTGTPSGVGIGFNPPKFLRDGDMMECYIEKIGKLVNKVSVV